MAYFTTDNTDGYTDAQIVDLNGAHAALVQFAMTQFVPSPDRAQVEKSEADALTNVWREGCCLPGELIRAVMANNDRAITAELDRQDAQSGENS